LPTAQSGSALASLPTSPGCEKAQESPPSAGGGTVSLYVHVPFCASRCRYCDFASEVRRTDRVALYLTCIEKEIASSPAALRPVSTVYVGGGTPSCLEEPELLRLFDLLRRGLDLSRVVEWTVEANPGTADGRRLALLRSLGADRLSLGVQSFDERVLRTLGRRHSVREVEGSIRAARAAGFRNVSLDLIFAAPGQSLEGVRRDLSRAVALEPEHISAYALTWEEGTALWAMRERGELAPPEESVEREMYLAVIEDLEAAGFSQYEISNFARPGRECTHNLVYWLGGEYVGLGPSAASYLRGERFVNARELDGYALRLFRGESPAAERERLEGERAAREALVLALRTRRGAEEGAFRSRTGYRPAELLGERGRRLLEEGWLETAGGALRLSRKALPVADSVLAELVL